MFAASFTAVFIVGAAAIPDSLVAKPQAAAFCSTLSSRVSSAGQGGQVTTYCSSYLSITATTTTTTSLGPGKTIVVTPTQVITSVVTTTSTIYPTTTVSRCADPFSTDTLRRRAAILEARALQKPSVLSSYKGSASLSSACGCLSLTTSTVTKKKAQVNTAKTTVTTDTVVSTKTKTKVTKITDSSTATVHVGATPTTFKLVAGDLAADIEGGHLGTLTQAQNGYTEIPPWAIWSPDYGSLIFTLYANGFGGNLLEELSSELYALQFANDDSFSVPDIVYFVNGDNYSQGGTYLEAGVTSQDDGTCN